MNRAYNHGSQGDFLASLEESESSKSNPSANASSVGEKLRLAARDGNIEDLRALVDEFKGQDIINEEDEIGTTALHSASSNGHPECVALLLSAGADKEKKNHYGQTPLAKTKDDQVRALLTE
eukprot:CAMPEP_0182427658 /NCGR_PEP_ID=MMETSP1167-20130531/18953_1 /TAXON_ID=2988 /ORGANISM="Mallomonas Sp, Strain CCMP3275" /LENGTH=121 /DNA_ID=CAMNT_0024610049 /DNA_START=38 /DNA_END=403 /DNA_ORIENTATION=-